MENRKLSRKKFLEQLAAGITLSLATPPFLLNALGRSVSGTQDKKTILVIGAGLAGLSAALELKNAGYQVKVLEARDRPGGRVSTLRKPFAQGLYAEEGAVGFSESYTIAKALINKYQLETIPWQFPDKAIIYHLNGQRMEVAAGTPAQWPFELSPEEQALGPMGIVQRYLLETIPRPENPEDSWNESPVHDLDQISLSEYLRSKGASEGAIKLLQHTQWFAGIPDQTSSLSTAISDMGLFMSGMPFMLKGGNDALPTAIANELGTLLEYNKVVNTVQQQTEMVTVNCSDGSSYSADYLICALPLKVLNKIAFTPDLAPEKRKAIDRMPVIPVSRTYVQTDTPFWQNQGLSGLAFTDLPAGQVSAYLHPNDPLEHSALLESYVTGGYAQAIEKLTESELTGNAITQLKPVFPELESHVQSVYRKCWGTDPYALGGPSWPAPGDVSSCLPALQAAQGRIFFAGEYTSIFRSTMEGALRSGISAAREIIGSS